MPEPNAWGADTRSYANEPNDPRFFRADDRFDAKWQRRLSERAHKEVQRAKERWNTSVREHLRRETRLGLSRPSDFHGAEHRVSVPIHIVGGAPRHVYEVLDKNDHYWDFLLNRSLLQGVVSGTDFMADRIRTKLPKDLWGRPDLADEDDLHRVRETARRWLGVEKPERIIEQIFEPEEDLLGAYFFYKPEIRLYWIVIGVIAQMLDVSVEALTVVVLVHELAHAYTHRGFDIDGHTWETDHFARSDLEVIEGLAQYFTESVCLRLQGRLPDALDAFRRLLPRQPYVYRAYRDWIRRPTTSADRGGEVIRVSMIEYRRRGIATASDFRAAVARYEDSVPIRPARGNTRSRRMSSSW